MQDDSNIRSLNITQINNERIRTVERHDQEQRGSRRKDREEREGERDWWLTEQRGTIKTHGARKGPVWARHRRDRDFFFHWAVSNKWWVPSTTGESDNVNDVISRKKGLRYQIYHQSALPNKPIRSRIVVRTGFTQRWDGIRSFTKWIVYKVDHSMKSVAQFTTRSATACWK